MSGQTIVRGTLSSKEIESGDFFCGASRGAYFNLTLSNRILRNLLVNNNINIVEYAASDYTVEDSFGPSGPEEPLTSSNLNNYRACDGLVVSFKLQNLNDTALVYRAYITLKVIPIPTPKPIHYYRQNNTGVNKNQSGDYFYTQNYAAIGDGSIAGFGYIGVAFKAYGDFAQGTIPVYRYFNPTYVNHFYTKTALTRSLLSITGLTYEGVEFYAYDYQYPGTVPVYRYFSPSLSNHFYTTVNSQYSGYDYEGIEFYAFPANANASRMVNKDNLEVVKTDNVTNASNIIAFPNPTTGLINIKNDSKKIMAVSVSNIFGEAIQTKGINIDNSELDLTNLPKGIYFVKVKSEGEEKVMRVVKE